MGAMWHDLEEIVMQRRQVAVISVYDPPCYTLFNDEWSEPFLNPVHIPFLINFVLPSLHSMRSAASAFSVPMILCWPEYSPQAL